MELGLYLPEAPSRLEGIDHWRKSVGPAMKIASIYQGWGSEYRLFRRNSLQQLRERGLTAMITWEPWRPSSPAESAAEQPAFALRSILEGKHDPYIRAWADACREFGALLLLRPMHEMNGDWYPWCGTVNGNIPTDYVLAWRHLHDLFDKAGAVNVRWVWSPYVSSHPPTSGNDLRAYYPGDPYVDRVALDGYNWGASDPKFRWQSFEELLAPAYECLASMTSKPLMVAEVASAEEGGDKAEWIRDMFASIPKRFPRLKAIVWFHISKERDWRIDSSPASREAFLRAAKACSQTFTTEAGSASVLFPQTR